MTNEDWPIKIVKDKIYPDMYRLKWEDGVLSEDMYNLSWAHDIFLHYAEYRENMRRRDPIWRNKRAFCRSA